MKAVMRELAQARRHYSKLPFFEFLRCEAIAARDRLAFYPCMAPFVRALPDLNRFVLRDESSRDPHQNLVNEHTHEHEHDHHWPSYLEDFTKLGFDRSSMKDDMRETRLLAPRLAQLIHATTPIEKLVIVAAIEETGNVLFDLTTRIAANIRAEGGPDLRYLGRLYFARETGHASHGLDHRVLEAIPLDAVARMRCLDRAFHVFDLFADWSNELLAYAQNSVAQRTLPQLAHANVRF